MKPSNTKPQGNETMQTETRVNGNKPKSDPVQASATTIAESKPADVAGASAEPTSATAAPEKNKGGKPPTMPHCAVYHLNGRVYAGVYNPLDKSSYVESGKGEGSAVGALVDSGFKLTELSGDGPEWLAAQIPPNAEKVQFAGIRSFPLPKQP